MTKKTRPLIGRIQETLASSAPVDRTGQAEPRSAQRPSVSRRQCDWLVDRIRRTATQFSSLAEHGGVAGTAASAQERAIRQERALLLGYKLTLTAWRRREQTADREVLTAVRSRMVRELLSAAAPNGEPTSGRTRVVREYDGENPTARRIRQTILDPADSDIAASLIRFEAGLPGPLTPFYGDLAPVFGGPCPSEALSTRYGKMVRHLYETIERKLDELERSDSTGSGVTRYAGAGR